MSGSALIEFVGHAGGDAELRFTPQGKAVANVSVAVTPRMKRGDEWVDGETVWYKVVAWETAAEALAEHVNKGDRVFVRGSLAVQQYTAKDGTARISLDVTVDQRDRLIAVVPKPPKAERQQQQQDNDPWQPTPDPWATDQPPF